MKYSFCYVFLLLLLSPSWLFSQRLLGLINKGGTDDLGTIIEVDLSTQMVEKVDEFKFNTSGHVPLNLPLAEANGKLYGVTVLGGNHNKGILYAWDTLAHVCTTLNHFNGTNGEYASSGLLEMDNTLYGVTMKGGDFYKGAIYSYALDIDQFDRVHSFSGGLQGEAPDGPLMAFNGRLFGIAGGGKANRGVLFSWQPDSGIYRVEFHFHDAGLIAAGNPLLSHQHICGIAADSGDIETRYVYAWDPVSALVVKKRILPVSHPHGWLAEMGDKLVGVSKTGGADNHGQIFSWNLLTDSLLIEADMLGGPVKGYLLSGFVAEGQSLYTGTFSGTDTAEIIVWNSATGTLSRYPIAIYSANGTLSRIGQTWYGTSRWSSSGGSIFTWKPGMPPAEVFRFHQAPLAYPYPGFTPYAGEYFGVATGRGTDSLTGGIFTWNPDTRKQETRVKFSVNMIAQGRLTAHNGFLYGPAIGKSWNGPLGKGGIYVFDPQADTLGICADFNSLPQMMQRPEGTLTPLNGLLYGRTTPAGSQNGVIYEFNPLTRAIAKVYQFDTLTALGAAPQGDVLALNGRLYGIAWSPMHPDSGFIYSIVPATGAFQLQARLGKRPAGNLTLFNGKCYGIMEEDLVSNTASLFEWNPVTNSLVAYPLDPAAGAFVSQFFALYNGQFYGITSRGGTNGLGTIFRWDPVTHVTSVLADLTTETGCGVLSYLERGGFTLHGAPTSAEDAGIGEPQLRIWPNPASEGWITVMTAPTLQEKALSIKDVTGREVAKREINGVQGKVSVEGLPPGVYWVRVGTATARFVVE